MTRSQISQFTSWLGQRSYEARLARFGIERLREIARENGKKGGRPKGSPSTTLRTGGKWKGGRPRLPDNQVSKAALYQRARRARLKQAAKAAQTKGR